MKRASFLPIVLVAALGLCWWLTRDPSTPRVQHDSSTAASAPTHEIAAPEVPPTSEREAASVEAATASPFDALDILVVDRSSAQPVAGAEVHWSNSNKCAPSYDREHPHRQPDIERLLANAPRVTTDAAGIARIDTSLYPGLICARRGNLFGSLVLSTRAESPIRIELSRDICFDVQVIDAAGKPVAGVPVGIRDPSARHADPDSFTTSTAGENGIARVEHLQQRLYGEHPPTVVLVHIATIGFDALGETVDLGNLPAEPVKLVLPACGSVVVTMHDSEGHGIATEFLNLASSSELEEGGMISFGARAFEPSSIEEGRAVYPFVPLGLEVYVDASSHGMTAHAKGVGPTVSGEQVSLDLDLGPPRPVLTGRLVDEAGSAIANCVVQTQFDADGSHGAGGVDSYPTRTDEDGRFRVTLFLAPSPDLSGTLTLRPYCAGYGNGEEVRITLDARIHAGENDFGDLVVHAAEILVRGRVIDDLGLPVALALIGGEVLESSAGKPGWRSSSALGTNCLSDGTFSVKGTAPAGRMRFSARSSGYVEGERVEATVGASDVTIVMTRASKIAGTVLLDEGASFSQISIRAERAGGTQEQNVLARMRERAQLKPDGSFELADVRPGLSDLVFSAVGQKQPILVIDSLVLRPGEGSMDPRLKSIDLRGKLAAPAKAKQE